MDGPSNGHREDKDEEKPKEKEDDEAAGSAGKQDLCLFWLLVDSRTSYLISRTVTGDVMGLFFESLREHRTFLLRTFLNTQQGRQISRFLWEFYIKH